MSAKRRSAPSAPSTDGHGPLPHRVPFPPPSPAPNASASLRHSAVSASSHPAGASAAARSLRARTDPSSTRTSAFAGKSRATNRPPSTVSATGDGGGSAASRSRSASSSGSASVVGNGERTLAPSSSRSPSRVRSADSSRPKSAKAGIFDPRRARSVLFETQQIMPSPGQTYFQLLIETDRAVLRDWPRQRLSQKWTRDGNLNPGQKLLSLQEFLDGEWEDQLVWIFGRDIYDQAVQVASNAYQELNGHDVGGP